MEEDEQGIMGRSILALGWGRWKRVFVRWVSATLASSATDQLVSFREANGHFGNPVYTLPDLDDDEADGEEGNTGENQ